MLRWMRRGRALAERAVTGDAGRLSELARFGSNPGALAASAFVPADLPPGAPLVVVLHGCTQTAMGFDRGSGWSTLAERHGFALLYPEQCPANNANLCFNWFNPPDIRRDSGEVLSIRQMIEALVVAHDLDRKRIYVTGLSAGGAMTMAMIAVYPELFAGAAVIAGLPYHCARNLPEAIDRMADRGMPSPEQLAAMVTQASGHQGPWPTLSVWHGDADRIVAPANADHIIDQWRWVIGVASLPDHVGMIDGQAYRGWRDVGGRKVIESYTIAGMDHGVPLDPGGADGCGEIGPFMLDAGISSTTHIARSWGLLGSGPADEQGRPGRTGVAQMVRAALRTLGLKR
jgi:poly(hydroxyalkanoate) depolymerase family esterase